MFNPLSALFNAALNSTDWYGWAGSICAPLAGTKHVLPQYLPSPSNCLTLSPCFDLCFNCQSHARVAASPHHHASITASSLYTPVSTPLNCPPYVACRYNSSTGSGDFSNASVSALLRERRSRSVCLITNLCSRICQPPDWAPWPIFVSIFSQQCKPFQVIFLPWPYMYLIFACASEQSNLFWDFDI